MRDHSKHIELKREDAIAKLIEVSSFETATETVSLHDALGRVTASDCPAKVNVPNALCAGPDGIAVRFADFENGIPDTSAWELGRDYGWANTGTAIPEGFDTDIRIEAVTFDQDGHPTISECPDRVNAGCSLPGSTIAQGELVVAARTKLTPTKISALAMTGYTQVEVIVKPKVVFIPTGDELVEIGNDLPAGKSYETNGILLEGKLKMWGAEPVVYPCLPDNWDQIKAAILKACDEADIVSINAGSSKGSKDFTMEILEEIGEVFCHETNHGPGRHTSASLVNGTPVLGLSGPPSGCEITADWYLKPLVDQFLYGHVVEFTKATVTLGESMAKRPGGPSGKPAGGKPSGSKPAGGKPAGAGGPGKDFFAIRPVTLEHTENGLVARPVKSKGMHANLMALDTADAYIERNPRTFGELDEGAKVEVELRFPYTAL